jgi:hypothetical protein
LPTAAELLVALDSRVAHHFSPAASQMKLVLLVLLVLPRTSFGRADLTAPVVVAVAVALVEAAKIAFAAAAVASVVAADYSTVPL